MTTSPPLPLHAHLDAYRLRIEAALSRTLDALPDVPPLVREAMRYSLLAGGKRVRPVLTLAVADAVAQARPERLDMAEPVACAIEFIHTYSLVHDDLPAMDNDTLRRGRPTAHVVFGEGLAILAGDALLTEAFSVLARDTATLDAAAAVRRLRVIQVVAAAAGAAGMVGGQAIDLHAAGQCPQPSVGVGADSIVMETDAAPATRTALDAAALRDMHARKTGALIRAAAVSGAIVVGGSDDVVAAIDRYASELGLAFQIVDDVLDVEGETSRLGKTVGKDAAAGKPTYPALFGLEASKNLARAARDRARDALTAAGLTGRLGEIADWVVARTN